MAHQHYFFVDPHDVDGSQAVLRDDEHHHLSRVVRLKPGNHVRLIDGHGMMYSGKIVEIGKQHSQVRIDTQTAHFGEEAFRLTLAQALPQMARFEWLLEKATEIGIAAFWPMLSQYSTIKSGKYNLSRWQRIVKAAVKQCGRSTLPAIAAPRRFEEILEAGQHFDRIWIAHKPVPAGAQQWSYQHASKTVKPSTGLLLIGPEGGFSEAEIELVTEHNCTFIDLGIRRLRSETAGLIAANLLLSP